MKVSLSSVLYVFLLSLLLSGCAALPQQKDQIVAQVNDRVISEKDWLDLLPEKDQETYLTFRKQRVDRLVAQTLFEQEAKRRQMSVQHLLEQEILSKAAPSHEEVHRYYDAHKKDYQGQKKERWEKEIEALLTHKKRTFLAKQLVSSLAEKSDIDYFFLQPKTKDSFEDEKQK